MRHLTITTLLIAALTLVPLAPVYPYTFQFTNTAAPIQLKWSSPTTIAIALSPSLSSPPANIKQGSDVSGAVNRALAHWSEAANIRFATEASNVQSVGRDGSSLITVANTPENIQTFRGTDNPGRARVDFDPTTGLITEADITINPSQQFSTDGTPGTYDLEATLTHEIGHLLGLDHSPVVGATMQALQGKNGLYNLPAVTPRTLSEDDHAGVRAIYGAALSTGGLTGSVSVAGGAPTFGSYVWAEDAATGRVAASAAISAGGEYRLEGLVPGRYRVTVFSPPVRVFEAGEVSVQGGTNASLNATLPNVAAELYPARELGTNGQLSTIVVPLEPNKTQVVYVGGSGIGQVDANAAGAVTVASPYVGVVPGSVRQESGISIAGNPGISFEVKVGANVPSGDYSIRLLARTGEVAYVIGGLTVDSNVSASANQIDDSQFYTSQHYRDFLNREPDAAGLAFWTNQIASCGSDAQCIETKRINVSAAYFLSTEFQQTGYFVYRFYKAAFGQLPRFSEFLLDMQSIGQGVVVNVPGWEAQLEANKQVFAREFVARTVFTDPARYPGSMAAEQFIDALLGKAFPNQQFAPNADLRQAALAAYGGGGPDGRARALRSIADNAAFYQREFNPAFVLMQYFGYLRRNPDDAPDRDISGYNFWLQKLDAFKGDFVAAEMVKAFTGSQEYRRRFGIQ